MTSPAPAAWRRFLGFVGGFVLGAVFLVAAWTKVLDPVAFAETIRSEGLEFILSARVVAAIALVLEVGLGAALVLGLRRRWVLWPSAALVIFFLFLTGRAYWRSMHGLLPDDAGCGCFGNLVQRTPAEAFWQDLLLMVPPLLLAFLGRARRPAVPVGRLVLVGVLVLATIFLAWKAPDLPLDDLATRLRPGVAVAEICSGDDDNRVCLDAVVPELVDGEHLVILTALDEPAFLDAIDLLNEHHWDGGAPPISVLSAVEENVLFEFRFGRAPAFDVREAPAPLLRPLYRTLPRAFRTVDGRVTETYRGMPPLPVPTDADSR